MSSFRKVLPQKTYRERSQPEWRKNMGTMEKHSDYQIRARKKHQKDAKIKLMREKAQDKNPDEYYLEMSRSKKASSGVTKVQKMINGKIQKVDQKKILENTAHVNLNLLKYKHQILLKKIEKLREQLHFIGQSKNNHTVFVDNEEELDSFDAAKYFDTFPALGDQVHNRPRQKTLFAKPPKIDKEIDPLRTYKKLQKAIEDEATVNSAIKDLELNSILLFKNDDVDTLVQDKYEKNPNLHADFQNVIAIKMKSERKK